ncbi:hypothetical protein [Teredinibacter turnerae]|uniref:hypothetical protein n=1 Tax=Teredinibacter turnerae TaxID=2426 RepID=UPI001E596E5D|nr:hypothetical protein [Teredinibacter turnerae]
MLITVVFMLSKIIDGYQKRYKYFECPLRSSVVDDQFSILKLLKINHIGVLFTIQWFVGTVFAMWLLRLDNRTGDKAGFTPEQ